jgi:Zn-dependent M28 family amino/carboxypeptidase
MGDSFRRRYVCALSFPCVFLAGAAREPRRYGGGVRAVAVLAAGTFVAAAAGAAPSESQRLREAVSVAGVREHLAAFQRIADANGGNRAAGSRGYDASADYVARRARAAGYAVRFQVFRFLYVADRTPPVLEGFARGRDFATMAYSGSGDVRARIVPVPRLGCEARDYARFPPGAVALVRRGACTFRRKADDAVAGGASAVIVANSERRLFRGTLGQPRFRVPVLAATLAVGEELRRGRPILRLRADTVAERRTTRNVIAESRGGDPAHVVMLGAHLDSVASGPGINDNASGAAAILELAEALAGAPTRHRVRFAWWGAEEAGLLGSRRYVASLRRGERARIALYLNLDMIGSPSPARIVYDAAGAPEGSQAIEDVLTRYFAAQGVPTKTRRMGSGSDHSSFAAAGIPVGGLFTGAGARHDPCYHRACDTLANVDERALGEMADAAAHALATFSADISRVRRH